MIRSIQIVIVVLACVLMMPGSPRLDRASLAAAPTDSAFIAVKVAQPARQLLEYRSTLPEDRPAMRGFRAPILDEAAAPWPFLTPPAGDAPPEVRRAADIINRRLAFDGLLNTAAQALEALAPLNPDSDAGRDVQLLREAGIPVDLLAHFIVPASGPSPAPAPAVGDAGAIVRHIRHLLAGGRAAAALRDELASIPFQFVRSRADFRVAVESGEHDIGTLRLQLTSGSYWTQPGDGSSLDIARQLVERLPDADFIVSIQQQHLDAFMNLARTWPLNRPAQMTVLAEPMIVSQWAADNGKAGLIGTSDDATSQPATIVPRYASRRDDGSVFVPNESFLIDSLASTGHAVVHSPLLFQGGNLMPVRDPASGRRILLIGEAELYRNTALGLTRQQALDAFRLEFAVDDCVVIPTVSFHLDYDVCIRAVDGRLVAFVNDPAAAVVMILRESVGALQRGGVLDSAAATGAIAHLEAGRYEDFLSLLLAPVRGRANAAGRYPLSFADLFAAGPSDSGVANLRLFLLAMDFVASWTITDETGGADAHTQAYLRTFRRQDAARQALNRQLTGLGFKVVAIPSLADGDRSITYINGIHDRTRYIMPAYGGLFAPLDDAARAAFQRELGPLVSIVPILCGESQRRYGAIHCSAAVHPRAAHNDN